MDKSYQCEKCGSRMVFDAKSQTLQCESCGHQVLIINDASKVVEHTLTRDKLAGLRPDPGRKTSTMECKGCGAKIEVDADCTAGDCPYCGNVYVLAKKQEEVLPPDGIVPFKIDYKQVGEIFRTWLEKRKFAPNALKNLYQSGKLSGMYLPYWTFDAKARAYYTAQGGKHRTEQRRGSDGKMHTVTHTDWFVTSGTVTHNFDDVLVRATQHMDLALLDNVESFGTTKAASWSPDYFAGYRAECYTKPLESGHQDARKQMERRLESDARQDVLSRFDAVKDLKINPAYMNETYKYLMLPVYTTSYQYGNETYHVVINGETGAIAGSYPKSPVKIILFIVAIIVIILLIFLMTK
ncbi:MAG: hypothetical protein IJ121_11435 [Eubacterium sp.]|nr:hypothetical protein [Eubacterium sp.]